MIQKLAHFGNIAVSKVALRSQTIGREETPQVLEDRDKCREQSLILRRWSQVQLDQPVRHVCLVLPGYTGCPGVRELHSLLSFTIIVISFSGFLRLHVVVG